MRNWSHTELLVDFCSHSDLFPVIRHNNSLVDYTYHSQMRFFRSIDHFIVSEKLFYDAVRSQYVLHDVDNTSGHEPLCLSLDINVAHMAVSKRVYRPRLCWNKAKEEHFAAYKSDLHGKLTRIDVPCEAIICKDFHCCNYAHSDALKSCISVIAEACLDAAAEALAASKQKGTRGCIPGWKEQIAPFLA